MIEILELLEALERNEINEVEFEIKKDKIFNSKGKMIILNCN